MTLKNPLLLLFLFTLFPNNAYAQTTFARFDLDRSLSLWLIHETKVGFIAETIVNTDKWIEVDVGWSFLIPIAKKGRLNIITFVGTDIALETGTPQSLIGVLLLFFDYSFVSSQLWTNYFLKFDRENAKDFLFMRFFVTCWNVGPQVELTYDMEKVDVLIGGTVGISPLKKLFLKFFLGKSVMTDGWIGRLSGVYSF
ncbi:hypothetical protein KKH43_06510 [Patescibacteria group bacterium]|nr:hypothetical protein [Patescibacteria group bacterium]